MSRLKFMLLVLTLGMISVQRRAVTFIFPLLILLIVLPPLSSDVIAQPQTDGKRTLEYLLRRLNAVATDPDNYTRDIGVVDISLTSPTITGKDWLRIHGDTASNSVTHHITRLNETSFCVTRNVDLHTPVPDQEECFNFTQITSIVFDDSVERNLQEMPLPGEQVYPQTSTISGLAARFDQLNEPTNTSPSAYTGYFLQFRHSIFGDNPDGLGVFVGVHYRGTHGGGINRVDAISYQQDYLCLQVLRGGDGVGMYQYYCVPHSNIAAVRLLRNVDVGQDIVTVRNADNVDVDVATLDVSDFLAAQQGETEAVADRRVPQTQGMSAASTDILTWWESGQTPLVLTLKVPIDTNGITLTIAHGQISENVDYVVTEVGEGYLCLASVDEDIALGELCTTFDNIAQVTPVND